MLYVRMPTVRMDMCSKYNMHGKKYILKNYKTIFSYKLQIVIIIVYLFISIFIY